MAKFFLRTSQKEGTAPLYIRISRPKLEISWWICTGIEVDVKEWNKAQVKSSALVKYYNTAQGQEVFQRMREVEDVIDNLFINKIIKGKQDKELLEQHVSEVVDRKGLIRKAEADEHKRKEEERARIRENSRLCVIMNYYADFMERMANGELRQGRGNATYRANSLSIWRTFGNHLAGYLKKRKAEDITFDKINKAFADGFTYYLEKKGLMLATINQQVNCFRRLCNAAAEDEKNANLISLKVWHSHEEKDEDKRAEIVLSESEVDALYEMKLDGLKEQARDMWCLGYFCAQRVSDYSRLARENFKQTPSGLKVIVLQQQKTGKDMVIPILDDRVFELCKKYDYHFPKLSRDNQNRFIKLVAKELSESVPTLKEWSRTLLALRERRKEESFFEMRSRLQDGKRLTGEEAKRFRRMAAYAEEHESGNFLYRRDYAGRIIRQRWELITCHTSRRSAVTAMYDSGIYDLKDIMAVSGHQTLKNVERYLKRDAISQAERIAEKAAKAKEIKLKKEG